MASAYGGAYDMRPLSWGGGTKGKGPDFLMIWMGLIIRRRKSMAIRILGGNRIDPAFFFCMRTSTWIANAIPIRTIEYKLSIMDILKVY